MAHCAPINYNFNVTTSSPGNKVFGVKQFNRTSFYEHPGNKDVSLLWTVVLVPICTSCLLFQTLPRLIFNFIQLVLRKCQLRVRKARNMYVSLKTWFDYRFTGYLFAVLLTRGLEACLLFRLFVVDVYDGDCRQ